MINTKGKTLKTKTFFYNEYSKLVEFLKVNNIILVSLHHHRETQLEKATYEIFYFEGESYD